MVNLDDDDVELAIRRHHQGDPGQGSNCGRDSGLHPPEDDGDIDYTVFYRHLGCEPPCFFFNLSL
jgi:hypothetical protein